MSEGFSVSLDYLLRLKEYLQTEGRNFVSHIELVLTLAVVASRFPGLRMWVQEVSVCAILFVVVDSYVFC
jgi:hypothetical protein